MKGILENIGPEERAWMSTPFHPSVSYIVSFVASVDLSLIYSLYDADPPFVLYSQRLLRRFPVRVSHY